MNELLACRSQSLRNNAGSPRQNSAMPKHQTTQISSERSMAVELPLANIGVAQLLSVIFCGHIYPR